MLWPKIHMWLEQKCTNSLKTLKSARLIWNMVKYICRQCDDHRGLDTHTMKVYLYERER